MLPANFDPVEFLRHSPEETARAFIASDALCALVDEIAEEHVPSRHGNDDAFAGNGSRQFVRLWRDAVREYAEKDAGNWDQVIDEVFGQLDMWSDMSRDSVTMIAADIDMDRYRDTGHEIIEAMAQCVENVPEFGEHARSNFMNTMADEIRIGNLVNDNDESLDIIIESKIDKKDFLAAKHDLVEFVVLLSMNSNEHLDDTHVSFDIIAQGHPDGMRLLKEMLVINNASGEALAEAMSKQFELSDEVKQTISSLHAVKSDQPTFAGVDDIVEVITNSNGGHAILYGFISARELLDLDPLKAIKISGNLQFGIHDFINGSGYLLDMIGEENEFVLPAGFLMEHGIGQVGQWSVNDVYDYVKSAIKIDAVNIEPGVSHDPECGMTQ